MDPAHVNSGQPVSISASAYPGARFVVRILDPAGGLVATLPLVGESGEDSTYSSIWTATVPGVYEVATEGGFPAELGTA